MRDHGTDWPFSCELRFDGIDLPKASSGAPAVMAPDSTPLARSVRMMRAMFDGFERLRGAELAAIEVQAFGIDHSAVGAYWVESIKFPAEVAAAIGNSLRPPEAMNSGLDLALNGACTLAAAVAKKVSADEALAALHPLIHKAQADANGAPKPSFVKLYDSLFEAEPAG